MIPKKIHYCWFGRGEKPADILGYINTWKKYMPDYEIIEWNEDNFNIDICPYVRQAYDARKFAFVSDYARIYALYTQGGVYFDTDIEVLRDPTPLFEGKKMVLGHEDEEHVLAAYFAAEEGLKPFGDLIEAYNNKSFILPNGKYDTIPNPVIVTEYMLKNGAIVDGTHREFGENMEYAIYPVATFAAYNIGFDRLEITPDTYTVHHCNGSWQTARDKFKPRLKTFLLKTIGEKNFNKLKNRFYKK